MSTKTKMCEKTTQRALGGARWLYLMVLMFVGMLVPQGAWADDSSGLEMVLIGDKNYYVLRSSADWDKFRQLVIDAQGVSEVNAIMDADITTSNTCATADSPYTGTFIGNGHTLNINIISIANYRAAFTYVKDATFRDLRVKGTVVGKLHSAGLIGRTDGSSTVHIERVWVSADVRSSSDYVGGIIGHADVASIYMNDCRYDGTLSANSDNSSYAGAIIGWSNSGGRWELHRVYDYNTWDEGSIKWISFSFNNGKSWGSNVWSTLTVTRYSWDNVNYHDKTKQTDVVNLMNGEKSGSWHTVGGQAAPVMETWPAADEVNFETYDMVPGTEKGEEGMLKIPFSCDQAVRYLDVTYVNENGQTKKLPTITYDKDTYAGFILVPATEKHTSLTITIKLKVGMVTKTVEDKKDAVLHHPVSLTTQLLKFGSGKPLTDAGAVQLTWKVNSADYNDVIEGDQFIVMRAFEDSVYAMKVIGSVFFKKGTTDYSFKDSLITADLTEAQLQGSSVTAYYKVMRAAAKELWGISDTVTSATKSQALSNLHLLKVNTDYKADWKDQTARTISVNWSYGNEAGAVWDSRAQMKLVLSSVNRNNAPVDTTTYVLTEQEMTACSKILTLPRSCVYYNLEFVTELGSTVAHYKTPEQDKNIAISSAADWATFVNMVKEAQGGYNVNAWLMADISITTTVGESAAPYGGVFDGNGHTLTCNINSTQEFTGPFLFVANATIRNLRTAGTITTTEAQAAGLIGSIVTGIGSLVSGSTVKVENCRSSVTLKGSVNGNGGFVGKAAACDELIFSNCMFDGSFDGPMDQSNGGFVGWAENYLAPSKKFVTIDHCLFAPTSITINTGYNGSSTWVRFGDSRGTPNITNSYYTKQYGFETVKINTEYIDGNFYVLRDANDWEVIRIRVNEGETVYAVMANDFTLNTALGESADKPFNGFLLGNGHTLTVNINGSGEYTAPFKYVGSAQFIDLHVTGSVKGGKYSSGLIGCNSGIVNFERVRVSTDVSTTSDHVGGYVGHTTDYGVIMMTDCRFDGILNAPAGSESYGGAIIGWSDNNYWNMTRVYENGSYNNIKHASFCYWHDGAPHAYSSDSFVSSHNWSEVSESKRNCTNQNEVAKQLGWTIVDGKAVPKMNICILPELNLSDPNLLSALGDGWTKDASGKPVPKTTVSQPINVTPSGSFYYENLGHIAKQSLEVENRPTSALLTWENETDEPVDYYEIHRYDKQQEKWDTIATQLTEMQYEDKATSPVHQYIYKVRGVTSCEGLTYDETDEVEGMCYQTASVEGHLRFLDGTGIPAKRVFLSVAGKEMPDSTDESGFFRIEGIPYQNGQETSYSLSVVGINGLTPVPVTFGTKPGDNVVTGCVIEVGESVKLSGSVTYDGTSIPVQGVSFMVDGYEVHNASGRVTTDAEGNFAFRMLKGKHDSIQAVKDGHTFWRGGFYHAKDDDPDTQKAYDFQTDKAGLLFYDQTRVKLIGRVVGGNTQGELPLGHALSKNNLGDNLQMVFTLEGDNSSRLVFDKQDRNKNTRDEVFLHEQANRNDGKHKYQTSVHTTLNRMVVSPDPYTGEYELLLPPVKWKIQQITAKGYATLFQDGQVGDVIDLTDSITMHRDTLKGSWTTSGDHKELATVEEVYQAKYSRIYHSPVSIEYRQQGFSKFDFFGDQYYLFKNLAGSKQKLTLAYGVKKENWPKGKKDSLETRYTFGYPVFSIEKKYPLWISATEKYYYNNNMQSDTIDVVSLPGGVVTIHNGMVDALHRDTVQLDSLGQGNYVMEIAQKPYLLTGDDALHTVTMTLLQDGTHYEAEPLKGYVFNILQPTGAQDIMSCSQPLLLDVLRDPPGGSSHATLAKGSTLKRAYTMDMAWKAGLTIGMNVGVALKTSTGLVVAPMGVGSYVSSGIDLAVGAESSINLAFSGSGERAFEYTMTTTEDISTSSDPKLVGADGDLYMGVVQNIEVKPATAIRAIPDSTFQRSGGELKSGRMVEIARGVDHEGYPLHLVRDEVLTYGTTLRSNFVHSQHYIIKQLIPQLTEQCQSLMFTGTKEEAQMQANALGEPVYWSKVGRENEKFGAEYEMILPTNTSKKFEDEVHRYHQSLQTWIEMISRNEKAKMNATDLVANYDVDGGTTINYSESFQSDYSIMNSFVNPFTPITEGYFDNGLANAAALVGTLAANVIGLSNGTKASVEFKGMGANIEVILSPVASFSVTPKHTESSSYSRTESFTVSMDKRSHLDFDVYRATSLSDPLPDYGSDDIFLSQDFWRQRSYVNAYLDREFKTSDFRYPTSFVYRTRGGATCRPWEGERKTLFNSAGTVLDVRTKKIENPQIKMDKQSLSGVPYGEPARFKLYITNESEQPEAAYIYFDLYQVDLKNPDGARLMIDGMPLTGTARTIEVRPGQVTEKTLEVYAGEKFDYEDLRIGVISQNDIDCYAEVAFDVHYLQTAGSVAILTPGDKWVLNTDAPQEKGKGWYLPVTIGGFDKNQHNFDHIEFQYKETNRGDDYWTNLCGYYADSTLYRAASGTKAMIPKNGNIQTRFFGEGQEMEKGYDLRAVLFCRNGNAFLTNESKVLSGVKDTRRPQLFGTPAPKTGVIGPGEDIIFDFSEDIEYNYLQKVTNFEVMGETNETAVQEAPSLQFGGNGYAQTQARRNFANKNVTVEVMIKTEEDGRDMPIFSHGSEGKSLQLWLTKERRLKAVVDGRELVSTAEVDTVGFQRVAMVLDGDNKQLSLYNNMQIGSWDDITYSGTGHLTFGAATDADSGQDHYFTGRMLQGRLWYRTMDLATLNRYSGRLLTGYELGLADYYPMNDGTGDYAADLAQGAHLMLSGASWAQPEGMSLMIDNSAWVAEQENSVYVINSADDWKAFCEYVGKNPGRDINARLNDDISVDTIVNANYQGVFEGNGHILNVNGTQRNSKDTYMAPFRYVVGNTVIRNLTVAGTIRGGSYTAGIVGIVGDDATLLVTGCHVKAFVDGFRTASGIVGFAGKSTTTVRNCLFDGSINNWAAIEGSYGGAFVGRYDAGSTVTVQNCMENAYWYYNRWNAASPNWYYNGEWSREYGDNNWCNRSWAGANLISGKSADELIAVLGPAWEKNTEGKAVPVIFAHDNFNPNVVRGLQLRTDLFQRDAEQDYTLMFWFKTAKENGTLLANGSGKADDEGALHKFFIGFEDHVLKYRTNGREFTLGDDLCNDAWHHYAMTVNRARNVASIYIDNVAKAQLTTDSLGGMLGTRFFLGNTVWQIKGIANVYEANPYTGHIDGLMLFEQALPTTLIRRYSTKSPGGEERGLIAHMPFDHQVQQKSGELALQPLALSTRVKRDNDGNDTGKRDSVFVNSVDEVLSLIDRTMGAPVQPYEHLRNLDFSYVGRNNQLMVNIKEQDARINKQNVYVTLYDIPDKNGNFMKSPVTESFYVNRNPLTWMTLGKHRVITIPEGTGLTLVGIIENNGGKAHTYTIENLPSWITVDKTSDIVEPQTTDEVDFTISKDLAVGSYDQIIYLVDEDGMSDAYYLELTVEGAAPDWTVAPEMKRYSMNIVAQVFVNNDLVTDSRDIVGAFDGTGRCMGVNNIEYDPATGRSMLFMTVYDSTTVATQLTFRLWHYATGKAMKLTPTEFINFGDQAIVGTVDKPVGLYSEEEYLQKLDLARGWNWVSFNVYNQAFASVESILSRFPWQEGDILTEDSEDLTLTYRNGQWMSNSNTDISRIKLSQQYSYRVKVQQAQQIEIWGSAYKRQADRTIKVKQGWNSIGYTPMVSLPVKTALTDYFDEAMPGDVVKNQHTFAMFTADGKGGGEWLGTLKYMKPGEGYMLHRQGTTEAQFCYPYYEPGTTFIENSVNKAPQRGSNFSTTMSVVAEAVGVDVEEGDRLVAYAGGEAVGSVECRAQSVEFATAAGTPLFFLSIEGDVEAPLSFAIERGDEIIATTGEVMRYEADGISGSPAMPTQISFVTVDQLPKDGWYTLQGIKLQDAPTQSGVYIYNGKKQVIK